MAKAKMIYKDKAGNKLYKRYIKTKKIWQFYAKNRQGRLIKPSGFNTLARKAGLKIQPVTRSGIQKRKIY